MKTRIEVTVLGGRRFQFDENGQKSIISPQQNGALLVVEIDGDYATIISVPKSVIPPRLPMSSLRCFDEGLLFPEGARNP